MSKYTRNRTKEDLKSNEEEMILEASDDIKAEELRWWYIELNDIENLPYSLIIFWTTRFIIYGDYTAELILIYSFPIYVISRILHTISFACQLLLPRMITYIISILCLVLCSLIGVVWSITQIVDYRENSDFLKNGL